MIGLFRRILLSTSLIGGLGVVIGVITWFKIAQWAQSRR